MLAKRGIRCSTSRNGDCWDNTVVEGFFGSLDFECAEHETFSRLGAR